ncbi:M48 family metallopeptidase [Teredinibacter franksiae]|uniref:M48 family metallopeptidase n=1 Tax=Teredinibacter franksiae TaxID=2761453 RepID=UPI001627B883|nr:M48 family metallopeptidase [Teredinibacter franksiae]
MTDEPLFENRLPPENINVSPEHPLKEFFSLLLGGVVIVVLLVTSLALLTGWLAPKIPFHYEQKLAEGFSESLFSTFNDNLKTTDDTQKVARQRYLDNLANKIVTAWPLPPGVEVSVHYIDSDTVNAFATIGGHILIFRGLLEKLGSENGIAFVLAHEVGHVAHRHPIQAMGRGLVIGLSVATIIGASDSGVVDMLAPQATAVTSLSFSRAQETQSDDYALEVLQGLYGHVNGASELFGILQKEHSQLLEVEFFSTHPLNKKRLKHIAEVENGLGELVKIPEGLFSDSEAIQQ